MSVIQKFRNIDGAEILLQIKQNDSSDTSQEITIIYNNLSLKNANAVKWIAILVLSVSVLYQICHVLVLTSFLSVLLALKIFLWFYNIKKESLLLVSSVGMQIDENYGLGRKKSRFIPWTNIKDVFINEIIQLQRVIFILSVHTINSNSKSNILIPVFTKTKPPLACLEIVYKKVQSMLNASPIAYLNADNIK